MLQGASELTGEQMIDKFKAKCSKGGKYRPSAEVKRKISVVMTLLGGANPDELRSCPRCK